MIDLLKERVRRLKKEKEEVCGENERLHQISTARGEECT